jgi:GTPase SAR1 family protein
MRGNFVILNIMGGSFGKKKSKIIIVGLDNSGKSTMINRLKPKKVGAAHPIIFLAFNYYSKVCFLYSMPKLR